MSPLEEALEHLKKEESIKEKSQVLEMILMAYARAKKKPTDAELDAVESFVFSEMETLLRAIPTTEPYRIKCDLFSYQNGLMGLFSLLAENRRDIGASDMGVAKTLVHMVAEAQWLEAAVDEMYNKEKICAADVTALVDKARTVTDEFQRGMLWQGTMHFIGNVTRMDEGAKTAMGAFICDELRRYIGKGASMSEEESANAEFIADVCQKFLTPETLPLVQELLTLPQSNVRFYAVATLLQNGKEVESGVISDLAHDITYADMTRRMLSDYKKSSLFPAELDTPEYLAKSNLVHWLLYPTELGCAPDEIELIGSVKAKGDKYYVFRFISHSNTLADDTKGKWLVGWASGTGGHAFSRFDLYDDFEKGTAEQTLKAIRKTMK